MNPSVITLFAGALCLPATYAQSRHGDIWLSVVIVGIIGIATGIHLMRAVKKTGQHISLWTLPLVFAAGAFAAETIFIVAYNTYYGWDDPKLNVGFAIAIVEASVIAVIGAISMVLAYIAARRITSTSRATP